MNSTDGVKDGGPCGNRIGLASATEKVYVDGQLSSDTGICPVSKKKSGSSLIASANCMIWSS